MEFIFEKHLGHYIGLMIITIKTISGKQRLKYSITCLLLEAMSDTVQLLCNEALWLTF